MVSLLVVRAHPLTSSDSLSMRLTDEFVRAYTEQNPDHRVTDLRLYDVAIPEIDGDLLRAWNQLREGIPFARLDNFAQSKVTLFDHYTRQFLESDKVVIANPLWNLQVPTRLKAWIDTITVGGTTFAYNPDGTPVGLVTGKRALHIQTAGGVFGSNDPASQFMRTLLGFIGVTDLTQIAAEGVDHEPERAPEIEADALRRVAAVARTF